MHFLLPTATPSLRVSRMNEGNTRIPSMHMAMEEVEWD